MQIKSECFICKDDRAILNRSDRRFSVRAGRCGDYRPASSWKTALARAIADKRPASVYLDLEIREDRYRLAEPALFLRQYENSLVVLDEIHCTPELFSSLRGIIDQGRRTGHGKGRFLILGSASIDLLRQSSESLAGRITYINMGPFNVRELPPRRGDAPPALDSGWVSRQLPRTK